MERTPLRRLGTLYGAKFAPACGGGSCWDDRPSYDRVAYISDEQREDFATKNDLSRSNTSTIASTKSLNVSLTNILMSETGENLGQFAPC